MTDDATTKFLVEISEGCFVENDVLDIVGQIQNYDPNLVVQFLRPGVGDVGDAPYRIMEMCLDGILRLVFSVWQLDGRVIERLFQADTHKQDILANLDKINATARHDQQQRFEKQLEEARDITMHVIKSPKVEYTIPSQDGDSKKVTVIHSHNPSRTVPVRKK